MGTEYRQWAEQHIDLLMRLFVQTNRGTSVPAIQREFKRLIKHYGLKNKYLPPDFKREVEINVSDPTGTEATPNPEA